MEKEIIIKKQKHLKGEDGTKLISIRIPDEILEELDEVAANTNNYRNTIVNILIKEGLKLVKIEED